MISKAFPSRRRPKIERRGKQRLAVESLEKRELLAVVSHWTSNNTALDAVGANHGTLQSGATYAAGQVGQAFSLDGSNDRVGIADSPSLALTGSMSIEAWIKADALPGANTQSQIFFRGDDRGGMDPYSLSLQSNGMIRFEAVSLTSAVNLWATIPLNQFVHVAGTLDDATGDMRLYLNSVLVSQTTTDVRPFGPLDPNSNPGIGLGNHGGFPSTPHNFPFDGLIDELRIYDHALSASEVSSHFNAEKGNLQPSITIGDASVYEDDASTKHLGNLVDAGSGGLDNPNYMTYGPDGHLYVGSPTSASVLRFDALTGVPLPAPGKSGAEFVSPGAGGLDVVRDIAFGPDGNLYVAGSRSNAVLRFDATTGEPLGALVPPGPALQEGNRGLLFHDGYLYVTSVAEPFPEAEPSPEKDAILRYDALTGAPAGISGIPGDAVFIPSGDHGLDNPSAIIVHNNEFYVASTSPSTSNSVLRYATDGIFIDAFVPFGAAGLIQPSDLAFHDGDLYVVSRGTDEVLRFDGSNGALVEEIAVGNGLIRPTGILFEPNGDFLLTGADSDNIRRYGDSNPAVFTATLSAPWPMPIAVNYATANGTAASGADYIASSGSISFAPGARSRTIAIEIVDDSLIEANETFTVSLSDPTGATIADGQGVGTIVDQAPLRQITISDSTATEGDTAAHYRGDFVDGSTGAYFNPLTFGPDGNLYTAVGTGVFYNTVQRYNGSTGEFLGVFAVGGGINGVRDIVFRDGFMYVASAYTDQVLRYNATTGAFVDVFAAVGSGGIAHPDGMTFGPDANGDGVPELYVTGWLSHNVVRYDGATGAPLGTYIPTGAAGMNAPGGLTFQGGVLYVASDGSDRILKFDALTGAATGSISNAALDAPRDVTFGSDGLLYVTSANNDRILRFTAAGALVGDYVPAGSGGMDSPRSMTFGPDGDLYVSATFNKQILRFGTQAEAVFTVSLSEARSLPVSVDFATANVSALAGSDYSAANGAVTFNPGVVKRTIRVPILNDSAQEATETFTVNLSNPSAGAAIGDGQGVGTILDNDAPPTKFFVVDDASANKTFEYTASGSAIENYNLNSGNAAPRGVATTAAGDKVWVVDTNNKVFVYDNGGVLLGSWTILALKQIEGITVWGNDLWVVDGKFDRVYKLDDGALRLSGQTYVNSYFDLTSGNGAPKDLVTDGAHIWVVNDANQDKVFKYTVAGASVGNWTITSGGGSPTGITLDPSNPSHLWTVDSATDRVYQYSNATTRTSGSQAAASSFALAAGNTNPQGIADPPVSAGGGSASILEGNTRPSKLAIAAVDLILAETPASARPDRTIDPGLLNVLGRQVATMNPSRIASPSAAPLPYDANLELSDDDEDSLSDLLFDISADWK